MKKIIRSISVLLALATLLCVFASCAELNDPEETTKAAVSTDPQGGVEGTTEVETTLFAEDDLEDQYNFNEEITIFLWSDHRMREYYAEESGDVIDDAIYHRNISVSKRLGITFDYVEELWL